MDELLDDYINSELDFEWCIDIWDEDKYIEDDLVDQPNPSRSPKRAFSVAPYVLCIIYMYYVYVLCNTTQAQKQL